MRRQITRLKTNLTPLGGPWGLILRSRGKATGSLEEMTDHLHVTETPNHRDRRTRGGRSKAERSGCDGGLVLETWTSVGWRLSTGVLVVSKAGGPLTTWAAPSTVGCGNLVQMQAARGSGHERLPGQWRLGQHQPSVVS